MTLTDEMLRQIMPNCPKAKRAECLPHLVSAMAEFNITNYLRASAFLATIAVESMEFRYFEEIASGAAYENRRDLGNTQPGDGKKYKGRGVIQVTGRANSEACLKFLGLPAGQPELLAELSNAFRSAGWFWGPHTNLNPLADQRQFLKTQIRVNGVNKKTGKPNGWDERRSYYERALRVLPEDLLVTDDGVAPDAVVVAAAGTAAALADNSDSDVHEATPLPQSAAEASAAAVQTADAPVADPAVVTSPAVAPDASAPAAPVAPVQGGAPTDPPAVVVAAAPVKERSTKSLVSTLAAALGSVAITLGALATKGAAWLKDNPELAVLFALAIVAIVVCYLLYQHRQTKLDLADRQHAKEVTLETMRIRSDPTLINVEVVPNAVPPEAPKG